MKFNQCAGNRGSLIVIDLHNNRIFQHRAGDAYLVPAARLNDRCSSSRGF
jgi:hypothetical protein